jgi:hypothetical protein
MTKLLLLITLLFALPVFANQKLENQFFLYNGLQLTSVETVETTQTYATTSTFTYYGVGFEYNYFWTPRFSTGVTYEQGISLSQASTNNSTGLKFAYFFLVDGTRTKWTFLNKDFIMAPSLAPYAAATLKRTSYEGETEQVNFAGFNFEGGANYLLWKNIFLRTHVGYDLQYSGSTRTLTSFNFYLGIGLGV